MPITELFFFCYPQLQVIDVTGPAQVFTSANAEGANYRLHYVGMEAGTIETVAGLPLQVAALPDQLTGATLLIPGGPGRKAVCNDAGVIIRLRELGQQSGRLCSVCSGAFVLAAAGFLNGRRAVTHWDACRELQESYPQIQVEADPLYIVDGPVWSSAGLCAGIDMALAMVEADYGRELAARVARRLVVYLRRGGGQKQFSEPLRAQQSGSSTFSRLIEQVNADPSHDWSVQRMADLTGLSLRTFQRRFTNEIGQSPAMLVRDVRGSLAINLLQTTALSIERVAHMSGFASANVMRRILQRQFGVSVALLRSSAASEVI